MAALLNSHLGWATINTRTHTGRIVRIGPDEWQAQDGNHRKLIPPLKNKDVAVFYLNEHSKPAKEAVRVLQISPRLKDAVVGCCRPRNMKAAASYMQKGFTEKIEAEFNKMIKGVVAP